MNIQEVQIGKIKTDPNQPRSKIDPAAVADMARSIAAQGIINPIEIDNNFVIVTGHVRYEGAKKAGLKTVPCREVNPENASARFQRQVIENLIQNSMPDMDIAKALHQMLSLITPAKAKKGSGGHNDKGITELAHAVGKSESYVHEKLSLLDLSPVMKKAITEKGIPSSYARALKDIPEDFKEEMEEKIIAEEFQSKESAMAVKRALVQYPDQGVEIMNVDYTGLDEFAVNAQMSKIIPNYSPTPVSDAISAAMEPAEKISDASRKLITHLQNYNPADIGAINIARVLLNLRSVKRHVARWLNEPEEAEPEVIEAKVASLPEGDPNEE